MTACKVTMDNIGTTMSLFVRVERDGAHNDVTNEGTEVFVRIL